MHVCMYTDLVTYTARVRLYSTWSPLQHAVADTAHGHLHSTRLPTVTQHWRSGHLYSTSLPRPAVQHMVILYGTGSPMQPMQHTVTYTTHDRLHVTGPPVQHEVTYTAHGHIHSTRSPLQHTPTHTAHAHLAHGHLCSTWPSIQHRFTCAGRDRCTAHGRFHGTGSLVQHMFTYTTHDCFHCTRYLYST